MNIGIDPGHGGSDPGAVGPTGLRESEVTLTIAKRLSYLLLAAGYGALLTRNEDSFVDLRPRTDLLNREDVHYTISIHCNASTNRSANYISTYIQAAGGEAEKLARAVQKRLVQATGWRDGGVRIQNLHMTREKQMPAILVECGFISNFEQEQQLRRLAMRETLAMAISLGIQDYLGKGTVMTVNQWKLDIIAKAKAAGLITVDHDPDEPASKWFVLQVILNALKGGK